MRVDVGVIGAEGEHGSGAMLLALRHQDLGKAG
jgi:hypothetical protein